MSTVAHPLLKLNEVLDVAANGNGAAREYLYAHARASRLLDNVVDGDEPVNGYELAEIMGVTIPANPFFQKHQTELLALHWVAQKAWQDADEMKASSDPLEQAHALVNGQLAHEIVIYVARLTGVHAARRVQIRRSLLTRK